MYKHNCISWGTVAYEAPHVAFLIKSITGRFAGSPSNEQQSVATLLDDFAGMRTQDLLAAQTI